MSNVLSPVAMNTILDPMTHNALSQMSHAQLYNLRRNASPDMQRIIAPYEHQAFAREFAQESPFQAAVSLPIAIPAYTAAKAVGLIKSRSPASWDEITHAYQGLFQGLTGQ